MIKLNFLYEKMILLRFEKRTTFALMYFVTKMGWFFQNTFQIKKFENSIHLLFLTDGDKSHYMYIKDFDRFIFYKTKS